MAACGVSTLKVMTGWLKAAADYMYIDIRLIGNTLERRMGEGYVAGTSYSGTDSGFYMGKCIHVCVYALTFNNY